MLERAHHASEPEAPLRILIWLPSGAGLHYNGTAISTHRLFEAMKARHNVVLTLVHGTPRQSTQIDNLDRIVALPSVDPTPHLLSKYLNQARFVTAGRRWLAKHAGEFDVLYTPAPSALTLLPALAAIRQGIPVVAKISNAGPELRDNGHVRALLHWSRVRVALMGTFSRVIAISKEIERQLDELGMPDAKVVYLPNSVDCRRFHLATKEDKANARPPLLDPGGCTPRHRMRRMHECPQGPTHPG